MLDIGAPSDGTVTNAKLGTDVISGETDIGGAIADADLFLLDDGAGGTLRKTAASRIKTYAAASNTPAFGATQNSVQSISNTTWTELTNYGREIFDTDSDFASSRFTPTEAGKYFFYGATHMDNVTDERYLALSKNGATSGTSDNFQEYRGNGSSSAYRMQVSGFFDLNGSSDYVSLYVYQATGGSKNYGNANHSFGRFIGYKIIT